MIRFDGSGTVQVRVNDHLIPIPITHGWGMADDIIPTPPTLPNWPERSHVQVRIEGIEIRDVMDQLEKVALERQLAERDRRIAELERQLTQTERRLADMEWKYRQLKDRLRQKGELAVQAADDDALWQALMERYPWPTLVQTALDRYAAAMKTMVTGVTDA